MDDADVCHYRLGEDAGDVVMSERGFEGGEVVELDDARRFCGIYWRSEIASASGRGSIGERDETFVDAAVVAIIVDENFRAAGDFARNSN